MRLGSMQPQVGGRASSASKAVGQVLGYLRLLVKQGSQTVQARPARHVLLALYRGRRQESGSRGSVGQRQAALRCH